MTATTKRILIGIGAVAVAVIAIFILKPSPSYDPRPIEDNCIYIERYRIEDWFKDGWDRRENDSYVHYLVFISEPGDKMNIRVKPAANNIIFDQEQKLKTLSLTDCRYIVPLNRPDTAVYEFTADDAEDGKLKDWKYLRLRQNVDRSVPDTLYYDVDMVYVKGEEERPDFRAVTKPCPPYCPKPEN